MCSVVTPDGRFGVIPPAYAKPSDVESEPDSTVDLPKLLKQLKRRRSVETRLSLIASAWVRVGLSKRYEATRDRDLTYLRLLTEAVTARVPQLPPAPVVRPAMAVLTGCVLG